MVLLHASVEILIPGVIDQSDQNTSLAAVVGMDKGLIPLAETDSIESVPTLTLQGLYTASRFDMF